MKLEASPLLAFVVPFLAWSDVQRLSSASRGLATSRLRDLFFRCSLVVVPPCPLTNALLYRIFTHLSPLVQRVVVTDPSHIAMLTRLPRLTMLRIGPNEQHGSVGSEYPSDSEELVRLGPVHLEQLQRLPPLEKLEINAQFDDLNALTRSQSRLQSLTLVLHAQPPRLEALATLRHLHTLQLRSDTVVDLEPLASLVQLQWLTLSSFRIHDITVLSQLPSLKRLDLGHCNVIDVTPLSALTNLVNLSLEHTLVENLWPLASLQRLQWLSLAHTPVNGLSPLAAFASSLVYLDVSGCTLTHVAAVASLQQLATLVLHNTTWSSLNVETSVSTTLASLPNLCTIDGRVRSLPPERIHTRLEFRLLQRLHYLSHLVLSGDSLSGRTRPVPLPHLVYLRVEWGYAKEPDIPLAAVVHPCLKTLHLVRVRLASLSNLRFAPQLEELRLIDVLMEDLSTLEYAANLTHVEHTCAMVRGDDVVDDELPTGRPPTLDFSVLGKLTKLRHLDLSYSSIRNLDPLRSLQHLQYVDLNNTNIDDASPLQSLSRLECIRLHDTEISVFDCGASSLVLQELSLPEHVDCGAIRASAPQLRKLLHPNRNCLWLAHAIRS